MELKQKIIDLMHNQPTGILATIRNGKPHSAFMMFFHEELTLYVATDKQSKKVDDIAHNDHIHVLLGRENKSWDEEFIEVEGHAYIEEDTKLKQKFWNDALTRWLSGPDDPNYVLLKIVPATIYYVDKAGAVKPEALHL